MTDQKSEALELVVRWGNLKQLFEDLDTVGGQAAEIETYAREQVFNRSGFDYPLCVLQPLSDVMDEIAQVFGDVRVGFDKRWEGLVSALALAAEELGRADDEVGLGYLKAWTDLAGGN